MKFESEQKKLDLILYISPQTPQFAMLDPTRLKQILINLLNNAIKFTHQGQIMLKLDFEQVTNTVGKFYFTVTDTGIGIKDEHISKLFNAFSQADNSTTRKFGGTGLGLTISNLLSKKMGSSIHVDSIVNKGSQFSFSLETECKKYEVEPLPLKNIIIYNTNNFYSLLLEEYCKYWNVNVILVDNEEILFAELQLWNVVDMVLADYVFCKKETIEKIRNTDSIFNNKVPFVLFNYSTFNKLKIDQYKEFESICFISKPIKPTELYNCLLHFNSKPLENPTKLYTKKINNNISILIAEDIEINRNLVIIMLQNYLTNLTIYEANNGIEAIEIVKNNEIDIILMDIQMPELDGIEAAKQIRLLNKASHIPIIPLTAHAFFEEKEKCNAAGMDDFITKPIDVNKLYSVLKKWITKIKINLDEIEIENQNVDIEDFDNSLEINYTEGLRRVGNNSELFKKILTDFVRNYSSIVSKINASLYNNNKEDLAQIIHTVKGVSANLGLSKLQKIADSIETALQNNNAIANIEKLVEIFDETLQETINQINIFSANNTLTVQISEVDYISMCLQLIEEDEMDAHDYFFDTYENILKDRNKNYKNLVNAFAVYDFDMAKAELKKLL